MSAVGTGCQAAAMVMFGAMILGLAAGAAAHKSCDVGYDRPSSNVSVLVLHTGQARNATAQLRAMGVFDTVGEMDESKTGVQMGELLPYSAVLVWASGGFRSPEHVGNVLSRYWDKGGAVVMAGAPAGLRGRFGNVSNGYLLFDDAKIKEGKCEVREPTHDLNPSENPWGPPEASAQKGAARFLK